LAVIRSKQQQQALRTAAVVAPLLSAGQSGCFQWVAVMAGQFAAAKQLQLRILGLSGTSSG